MKQLFTSYEQFRTWFNKMFSLSLNGKFVGLGRLFEYRIDWKRFQYKLYKILNGYYRKVFSDVISMSFHGVCIKLYNR